MKKVDFGLLNSELAIRTFISRITVEPDASGHVFNLILELASEPDSLDRVTVSFRDIADLRCDLPMGGWCQVHMLGVRSCSDGQRPYLVEEIEYSTLRFRCKSAEII